jgi:hypothetical protein
LQGLFFALFSQVSSSGGGLPGRLDLIEIEALVILGPLQGKLSFPNRSEESGFMLMLAGNQDPSLRSGCQILCGTTSRADPLRRFSEKLHPISRAGRIIHKSPHSSGSGFVT